MCHSSHYRFGTHPALWIEDLVNVCVSIRLPCDRIGWCQSRFQPVPWKLERWARACARMVVERRSPKDFLKENNDWEPLMLSIRWKKYSKKWLPKIRRVQSGDQGGWFPGNPWLYGDSTVSTSEVWLGFLAGSYGVNFIARNPLVAWFTLGIILPGWKEGITIMQNYAVLLCMFISMMGIPVLEMGSFFVAKNVTGFSMGSLDPVRTWQVASKSYLHVMCLRT